MFLIEIFSNVDALLPKASLLSVTSISVIRLTASVRIWHIVCFCASASIHPSSAPPALACARNHQRGNFRDCFVVQLSKFVAARLKQLVYFIKSEEVCQQLFSFIFKFLFDLTDSVLFRVVPADSLYIISSLPASVNTFFLFSLLFSLLHPHQCSKRRITLPLFRLSAFICTWLYYFNLNSM